MQCSLDTVHDFALVSSLRCARRVRIGRWRRYLVGRENWWTANTRAHRAQHRVWRIHRPAAGDRVEPTAAEEPAEGPGSPAQGACDEDVIRRIVVQVEHQCVGNRRALIVNGRLPTLLRSGRVTQLKCTKTASDQYRVPS